MGRFALKRFLQMIPTLFFVLLVIFSLMKLIPGDPALTLLGPEASPSDVAAFREELGLNKPLPVQFLTYLRNVARGDLGRSLIYRTDVLTLIAERLPTTLVLSLCALSIAILLGVPLGIFASIHHNGFWDMLITVLALLGVSVPIFWVGMLLIVVFVLNLGLLPSVGLGSWDKGLWNVVSHFILPSCALAFQSVGTIARFTRSSMLEVLRQDYIRTAHAKGLRSRLILERHALRNALIPVVTVAGLQLGHLLAGAVLTESIFALPGLGKLMVDAIMRRDFLLVQGEVLVIALLYLLVNFLVDLLYALLNPKIRKSFGGA
ncbi:ABC transporter permease [Fretibacterium sp. OH1220_COT-178]|uniref:ABC transporter permease n=1 Tax=Fretibacterium sp. OH1220_COT-178 TaxID=2491047 RepID=UPI000F5E74AE|nr:ABC transporter permease [Fretibacterium sp. OH1220_COT-178]RRD66009.1 ABC transporter permease [Fretibacterium sp. OH1220_COT-178]